MEALRNLHHAELNGLLRSLVALFLRNLGFALQRVLRLALASLDLLAALVGHRGHRNFLC